MAGWYFQRMLLLLESIAYMLAYNDTDQCQVCQTPLIQNPRVPWRHLLKNTTYYFFGLKYRDTMQVLPNNSFVSGTYIQVCNDDPTPIIAPDLVLLLFVFSSQMCPSSGILKSNITQSCFKALLQSHVGLRKKKWGRWNDQHFTDIIF